MPKIGAYYSPILPDDYTYPMPEITLPYVQECCLDNRFSENQPEEIKVLKQVIEMQGEIIKQQRKKIFILSGKKKVISRKK